LDAIEILAEECCASLCSQFGWHMTALEAIDQSHMAELTGEVICFGHYVGYGTDKRHRACTAVDGLLQPSLPLLAAQCSKTGYAKFKTSR